MIRNIYNGLTLKYIEINGNEEKRVYEDDKGIEHRYIKNYDIPDINYYVKSIELETRIQKAIEYISKHNCIATYEEYKPTEYEYCCNADLLDILKGGNNE